MNRFAQRNILLLLVVSTSASLCGCGASSAEPTEEVEHTRPDHWPNTFIEAVTDIESRFDNLSAGSLSDVDATELRDLLKWLPDVAGDTSLDESNWTRAVDAGRALEAALASGGDTTGPIAALREISTLTADDQPPYVPGRHVDSEKANHQADDDATDPDITNDDTTTEAANVEANATSVAPPESNQQPEQTR